MRRLTLRHRFAVVVLASSVLAGSVLLWPEPAAAQYTPAPGVISTQGHGEVKVRPDSLNVSATVESKAPTLAAARTENNKKTQAIINALKGLNIPNMKLETQNVQVYPIQSEPQNSRLPKVIGYQVTNGLGVTVTGANADALGDAGSRIVDTALNAGANNVGGLNFFLNDMASARAEALSAAVQDARRNADAMARAAGVTVTGLHSLEGSPQYGYPRPVPMYATMKAERAGVADVGSTPIETGETTITSDVTARFKF